MDAKAVTDILRRTREIELRGIKWTCAAVSLLIWDKDLAILKSAVGENGDAAIKLLNERIGNFSDDQLREVLGRGVIEPKLSAQPADGQVWIEDVIRNTSLANSLYVVIVELTLEALRQDAQSSV